MDKRTESSIDLLCAGTRKTVVNLLCAGASKNARQPRTSAVIQLNLSMRKRCTATASGSRCYIEVRN
jgi:hypothetical protein